MSGMEIPGGVDPQFNPMLDLVKVAREQKTEA